MSNLIDLTSADDPSAGDQPLVALSSPPLLQTPLIPLTPQPRTPHLPFLQHPLLVQQPSSFDSNPFDQAQQLAAAFDDPFESVHSRALQKPGTPAAKAAAASVVSTATLIQLDSATSTPVAGPVTGSRIGEEGGSGVTEEEERREEVAEQVTLAGDANAEPATFPADLNLEAASDCPELRHYPIVAGPTEVNTATLIQLDSATSTPNAKNPPPPASAEQIDNKEPMDFVFDNDLASAASATASDRPHSRNLSDSDISSVLKSLKSSQLLSKNTRSMSLDQLVRRNQMLKQGMANAPAGSLLSPIGGGRSESSTASSTPQHAKVAGSGQNTPRAQRSLVGGGNESFDDLMATSPRWLVDSEADDSDMEQLCIPFLREGERREEPESEQVINAAGVADGTELASGNEAVAVSEARAAPVDPVPPKPRAQKNLLLESDRGQQLLEQLERHKAMAASEAAAAAAAIVSEQQSAKSPPLGQLLAAVPEEDGLSAEQAAPEADLPTIVVSGPQRQDREHLAGLLASVKKAIERFDNHSEAKAMLAGLNSALDMPESAHTNHLQPTGDAHYSPTDSSHAADTECTPTPIVRQGTFNLEEQLRSVTPSPSPSPANISQASLNSADHNRSSSRDASPNSTNIASVVEQLGRLDLSRLHAGAARSSQASGLAAPTTTYIVVMNTTGSSNASSSSTKVRTKTSTPRLSVASSTDGVSLTDDDSPSSYLKTRSASMSQANKPSAVAAALAAKAEMRQRVNGAAGAMTPLRTGTGGAGSSVAISRRQTFSQAGQASVRSTFLTVPGAASASRRTSLSQPAAQHRSPQRQSAAASGRSPQPRLAPSTGRSPGKLASMSRRSLTTRPGPPSMLKASAAPPISQLKLRTAAAASGVSGLRAAAGIGGAAGPMRATAPLRSVVAPSARTASVAAPSLATPRKSAAALAHSTPAFRPPTAGGTPSRLATAATAGSALPRISATPAPARGVSMIGGGRVGVAAAGGAGGQLPGLTRRRSMSEGKATTSAGSTAAMRSGLAARGTMVAGGGSRLATGVAASSRRLSTLPTTGRNKENTRPN